MRITAQHLKKLGVIDRIVKEPVGGAHRDVPAMARNLAKALDEELDNLSEMDSKTLMRMREERFLQMTG